MQSLLAALLSACPPETAHPSDPRLRSLVLPFVGFLILGLARGDLDNELRALAYASGTFWFRCHASNMAWAVPSR